MLRPIVIATCLLASPAAAGMTEGQSILYCSYMAGVADKLVEASDPPPSAEELEQSDKYTEEMRENLMQAGNQHYNDLERTIGRAQSDRQMEADRAAAAASVQQFEDRFESIESQEEFMEGMMAAMNSFAETCKPWAPE